MILRLVLVLMGLGLTGCFLRAPGKPLNAAEGQPAKDSTYVPAQARSDDSLTTLTAQFARLDSIASPDSGAAEILRLALVNYLGMAQNDGKYYEVKLWLANHLFEQDEYDSALALYRDILEKDKDGSHRAEASQMVAQTYVRLGDADKAEAWYQQQLKSGDSATSHDARDRLAQALYVQAERAEKEGKLEEAAKFYGDVTRAFPSADISPIALYNCTVLRERLGQWQKALAGYNKFTELYYNSPMLPRVLFRQAKTRERLKDWAGAADGFWKLANTYPASEQGEPALYNAGFAFVNARQNEKAAQAFEAYAVKYPQMPESPNLLFRAAEMHAERQNWERVADLQSQFMRKYGQDRNRLVQAQCLGGLAAYHQGRIEVARDFFTKAVESYRSLPKGEAQPRIYAAQSQFLLGEISHAAAAKTLLRESNFDADVETKTRHLKMAAAAYLRVIDYRIAEWALRSAHAMGKLFEGYGNDFVTVTRSASRKPSQSLEFALQNLETAAAAWIQASENYTQAQAIAKAQNLNNRYVEEAATKPDSLRQKYARSVDSLWSRIDRIWPINGLPGEKAIGEAMERLAYRAVLATQAVQVGSGFDKVADSLSGHGHVTGDSGVSLDVPSVAQKMAWIDNRAQAKPTLTLGLKLLHDLGRRYQGLADTVRSAPRPVDSMEAFFFLAKLVREGLAPIEKETQQAYEAAFQVAQERKLKGSTWMDSLRAGWGYSLYVQAKSRDLLAHRALANPPIPADAPPAMRKTFEPRFEELGYQLRDEALAQYQGLVKRATAGQVETRYAELALLRLFEVEPGAWSQKRDTSAVETATVLVPHQPWNRQDMTPERMRELKQWLFEIPHFRP